MVRIPAKSFFDPWFWGLLTLLTLGALLYGNSWSGLPEGHHAWAMADYYAMALNFADHNLDLLHPRTYNLMTREGITAVDFPLPAWLAALAMKITGSSSPAFFRILTSLAGISGILFFYQTLRTTGIAAFRSVLLSLLFWCFPTLLYYYNGFMPSVWAFSAFLAGVWGMAVFEKTGRASAWAFAVGALALAALIRKPFVLHFATWALFLLLTRSPRRQWWYLGAGLLAVGSWQVYSLYIDRTYGSLFLNHLMAPRSFREALALTKDIWSKWLWTWFTAAHLVWLAGISGLAVFYRRREPADGRSWGLLCAAACGLAIFYFGLMLRQYPDHEYYFIDSFYPAIFMLGIFLARRTRWLRVLVWAELLLLIAALALAYQRLSVYRELDGLHLQENTAHAYEQAGPLLDRLGVSPQARILVLEAYSFNRPFLKIRRRGYTSLSSQQTNQEALLAQQPDYVACLETSFVSDVVNDYPGIVQRLEYVGRDSHLLVFRPGNFALNTLESLLATRWETLTDISGFQTSDEFIFNHLRKPGFGNKVLFYGQLRSPAAGELKATVALVKGDQTVKIYEKPLYIRRAGQSVFCSTEIDFEDLGSEGDGIKIYVWNPGRLELQVERFSVSILK